MHLASVLFAWAFLGLGSTGTQVAHLPRSEASASLAFTSDGPSTLLGCSPAWLPTEGPSASADGAVKAACVYDDGSGPALYVGGDFEHIGGQWSPGLGKFDGAQWSSVGATTDFVRALTVYDSGAGPELIVGGFFVSAGGIVANSIARFDGTTWSELGSGLLKSGWTTTAAVRDMCVFDDGGGAKLYVAGDFETAGGTPAKGVARWNGQNWSALPGVPSSNDVWALTVYPFSTGPRLVLGGRVSPISPQPVSHLSTYDGTSWASLANVAGGSVSVLATLDIGTGPTLYVAGNFAAVDGVNAGGLASWNGATWRSLGSGAGYSVTSFEVHDDGSGPKVFVGGGFSHMSGVASQNLARWNGTSWSATTQANTPWVQTLTRFTLNGASALFVGGTSVNAGETFLAHRGSEWTPLSGGFSAPVNAVHDHRDATGQYVVAAGYFGFVNDVHVRHIARWDGSVWRPMGAGFNGPVHALEVVDLGAGPTLFATGDFTRSGAAPVQRIARWSGTDWQPLGVGLTGTGYALLGADLGGGSRLYVGGQFQRAGNLIANSIASWNGSSWTTLGSGATLSSGAFGKVKALEEWHGLLFVGGHFGSIDGIGAKSIASWNGTLWSTLGNGVSNYLDSPGFVESMEVHDAGSGPELYVGGGFEYASVNDGSQRLLARWNGTAWGGTTGFTGANDWTVGGMKSYSEGSGRALYVGTSRGFDLGSLERLGSTWTTVASFTGFPSALDVFVTNDGPVLFVAGSFHSSPYGDSFLTRWDGCAACPAPASYCTAGTTSQGCVASISSSGVPSASQSGGFVLSTTNVDGQRSGMFFYGVNGQLSLPWHAGGSSFLCVRQPLQRLDLLNSGGAPGQCNGQFQIDLLAFLAAHPGALGAPLSAGTQVRAQTWFRDPPAAGSTSLSDALAWVMCP